MKLSSIPAVESATCSCAKGIGQACGHVTGLLYQLANFKLLKLSAVPEDVAKTSQPMTWHQPRGPKIKGTEIQKLSVVGYSSGSTSHVTEDQRNVSSTLFNPVRGEFPKMEDLKASLVNINSNALILPVLGQVDLPEILTKFGTFPKGSAIAVQQPLHSDYHVAVFDGVKFPTLPTTNRMVR